MSNPLKDYQPTRASIFATASAIKSVRSNRERIEFAIREHTGVRVIHFAPLECDAKRMENCIVVNVSLLDLPVEDILKRIGGKKVRQ